MIAQLYRGLDMFKILIGMILTCFIGLALGQIPENNIQLLPNGNHASLNLDVIIAVDNSESMSDEVFVLSNQIAGFYNELMVKGYDTNIILVSDDSTSNQGLCIPPSLGSGFCPNDDNLPAFRHVNQHIFNFTALDSILNTYNSWNASLRDDSIRAVVVVSDNESSMSANDFINGLVLLDSDFNNFQFHAIAAEPEYHFSDPCYSIFEKNPPAEAQGLIYQELTMLRNGIFYDICSQDFAEAWDLFANQIDVVFTTGFE